MGVRRAREELVGYVEKLVKDRFLANKGCLPAGIEIASLKLALSATELFVLQERAMDYANTVRKARNSRDRWKSKKRLGGA